MKRAATFFILGGLLASSAAAQTSVSSAIATARKDLNDALARLAEVRKTIGEERPALATEFHEAESELRNKRRQVRLARTAVEDRREMRRELETTHYQLTQDASWLSGLLKDHALKMQTQTEPGMPVLRIEDTVLAGQARDAESLEKRSAILQASVQRLAELMGGSSVEGEVAGPEGEILSGRLIALGPESWFSSADGRFGGPVVTDRSGAPPKLLPGDAKAARTLALGQEAVLELDFTNGKARSLAQADDRNLFAAIRAGGLWIWPILGLALLSLVFGSVKLYQFRNIREPGDGWLTAILEHTRRGDADAARQLAASESHPAGEVLARAVGVAGQGAEAMEETIYEQLIKVKAWTGSLLPVIAVTAATAPLLGLLGTVSGMIRTFNLITLFGSGDPKPLAGGISEALITTFFGLMVAIPALILHAFLSRRSHGILQSSERLGLAFVNGLREPEGRSRSVDEPPADPGSPPVTSLGTT